MLAAMPGHESLVSLPLEGAGAARENALASLRDDELSPAALATRVVIADVARQLVAAGRWAGAELV
jgi:LysR family transcriptional regulator, regulatory protein for tcuABC